MTDTVKSPQTQESILHCPSCRCVIKVQPPTMPFCSERCRMSDLGKWFNESYTISRGIKPEDLDELDS